MSFNDVWDVFSCFRMRFRSPEANPEFLSGISFKRGMADWPFNRLHLFIRMEWRIDKSFIFRAWLKVPIDEK
ncbi:hypothetical protein CXU19_01000 [Akkermansia muciniphila]|jgi:hypothetical protein|nr:hypothetical protein [Akkermansia muciniphila]PNC26115.1 hypothetical protein CXU19_01000 [Akkermansia muciniphila]PNC37263.1 hypothetical protein CXU20_12945 [Akkermansia muciniphila]GLV03473.1 hypothetical protein Aksp01_16550 [Akkermansia sp. NBRC 115031]